ncbi:hypothetical protein AYI69_g425 [Smittium culicis]|uniref:CNH domain-containing protein n=1 Tax=Smittium culicis TaxID=133412 RepID=A0A1R1YT25_9FUNG|nr:hypothetical protein AYI69_g425 [Smittium culicis]
MADIKSYKILNLENIENVVPLVSIPNSLVDPLTGKKVRPPRPRVGVVGKNEFIILTISSEEVGSLGVIVGVNGDARRGTLQFPEHPRSFIYDSPYIIALFSDGRAEFHNTHTSEVVEYNFISTNGKKPRGVAFVSSMPALAMSGEFEETEIPISEESNECQKNFSKADFSNRYSDFNCSDTISNTFSAHVVVYYSETICNLLDEKRVEEAIDEIELSLSKSTKGFHESREIKFLYQRVSLIFLESLLFDDALDELFSVLKNVIDPLESLSISKAVKKSVKSMKNINTLVKNGSSQFTGGNSEIAAELELTLLQNASDLLFRFLIYCNKVYKDYELLLPVCTSLALLYSDQKETEKYKELLYDQKNFIDCDVVVNYCNSKKNYYFASLAYKTFEKAEQTLNIWEDILSGKIDEPDFKGEVEYLNYITELNNEELTSKRFYKTLNFNTSLAVKMFYNLSPGTVAGLNTDLLIAKFEANGDDEVLGNFIQRLVEVHHSKSPVYSTLLVQIRIRDIGRWLKDDKNYSSELSRKLELENSFRIRQNSDMGLSFRDFLVGMINSINKVKKIDERINKGDIVSSNYYDFSDSIRINHKEDVIYDNHLKKKLSPGYTQSLMLRYHLLELLLDTQQLFDINTVFETIKLHTPNYLYLEIAVLLIRIGELKDAINILIHKAQDFGEAEILCLRTNQQSSLIKLDPQNIEMSSRKRLSASKQSIASTENNKKTNQELFKSKAISKFLIKNQDIRSLPIKLSSELSKLEYDKDFRYLLFFEYLNFEDPELGYKLISGLVTRLNINYNHFVILNNLPTDWVAAPLKPYFKTIIEANSNKANVSRIAFSLLSQNFQQLRSQKFYVLQFPELAPTFIRENFDKKSSKMKPIYSIIGDIDSYFPSYNVTNSQKLNSGAESRLPQTLIKSPKVKISKKYDIESVLKNKTHIVLKESDNCKKCEKPIKCDNTFFYKPTEKAFYHKECIL